MKRLLPRMGTSQSAWTLLFTLGWARIAWAHVESGQAAGFVTGLQHPWSGLDHVLAMIAVGLWGAQLGSPALWMLPIAFPMMMAAGAMLGLLGIPVPGVEIGIALSALLLGIMILAGRAVAGWNWRTGGSWSRMAMRCSGRDRRGVGKPSSARMS